MAHKPRAPPFSCDCELYLKYVASNPWSTNWHWSVDYRYETPQEIFLIYLLPESKQSFILKNYCVLSVAFFSHLRVQNCFLRHVNVTMTVTNGKKKIHSWSVR